MAAESKRQLGIKTRAVKRLAADVRSYLAEKATLQSRLHALSTQVPAADAGDLRRAREFVEEAEATIVDVRQRLQESYNTLERYTEEIEMSGDADVLADQSFIDARNMLNDIAPLVRVEADEHKEHGFKVAVFGSGQLTEDDELWSTTEELGERLAQGGYHVLSGGYNGTSEALSFGASRVQGARIEGVTVPSLYPSRPGPNQYIKTETKATDLNHRMQLLQQHTDAFIVLPGGLGTMSALTRLMHQSSVEQNASKPPLLLLVWNDPWQSIIRSILPQLNLLPESIEAVKFVSSVDEIVAAVDAMKQRRKSSRVGVHGVAASAASSSSSSSS